MGFGLPGEFPSLGTKKGTRIFPGCRVIIQVVGNNASVSEQPARTDDTELTRSTLKLSHRETYAIALSLADIVLGGSLASHDDVENFAANARSVVMVEDPYDVINRNPSDAHQRVARAYIDELRERFNAEKAGLDG